jgi:hypothetical protein
MYVDAYNLVISPRGEELASRRESHGMDGPGVIAHGCQLLRLVVGGIRSIVYCFGGPYSNMAVFSLALATHWPGECPVNSCTYRLPQ